MSYFNSKLDRIDVLLKIVGIEFDDHEGDGKLYNIMRLIK